MNKFIHSSREIQKTDEDDSAKRSCYIVSRKLIELG
jgi:hypothetical protein